VSTSCTSSFVILAHSPKFSADRPVRAPTLSYTERLERRVQQLEAQLSQSQGSVASSSNDPAAGSPSAASSSALSPGTAASGGHAARIEGLKVDDKGMITYHGSTSFFQAVSSHAEAETRQQEHDQNAGGDVAQASRDIERRERLVNNAWQQRMMESYSGIPVGLSRAKRQCWVSAPY